MHQRGQILQDDSHTDKTGNREQTKNTDLVQAGTLGQTVKGTVRSLALESGSGSDSSSAAWWFRWWSVLWSVWL